MARLISIAGELLVEIRTDELNEDGGRHLVANTRIIPGGRSYRQALYAKNQGYNSILLGRIGDDYYGRLILESLNGLGISTQFIEMSRNEYTGMSFEVCRCKGEKQSIYLDTGASTGSGDFQFPVQNYLMLCDVIILNQWFPEGLASKVLDLAEENSIPTFFVGTMPSRDALVVDYVFLESDANGEKTDNGSLRARKGLFIRTGQMLTARLPSGKQLYKVRLEREWDGDYLVIRLMQALRDGASLEATEDVGR